MVSIKPLNEIHAKTSYKWRNNPEIWKYTFNKPDKIITPEIEREWIQKVLLNENERRFAIYYFEHYVGNIYLTSINKNSAFYGIFIGDLTYTGKGIAKEASLLILSFAKNELSLDEIFLRVKKANQIALKLYDQLGFQIIDEIDDFFKMRMDLNNLSRK